MTKLDSFCQATELPRSLRNLKTKAINFASNNYLGAREGFGSSRLLSATQKSYSKLEQNIAAWKKTASSLVFPTGYMANVGTIPALMQKGDLIIIDKLVHASIIDGCRLSGADLRVFKHNDVVSLQKILEQTKTYKKKLIIVESVYSMDGDLSPLTEIVQLAKKYGAWTYVDEAHAVGVFGPKGAGRVSELGLSDKIDIQMGTLSKGVGGVGGYIAGSSQLIKYLVNTARSFIYTTGLPDTEIKKLIADLAWLQRSDSRRRKLWDNVRYFYELAKKSGLKVAEPKSPIIPIMIGDEKKAVQLSEKLLAKGIFLPPVRYPTVPKGQARLRCTITAEISRRNIEYLVRNMVL